MSTSAEEPTPVVIVETTPQQNGDHQEEVKQNPLVRTCKKVEQ
jgi:hypothetical protein